MNLLYKKTGITASVLSSILLVVLLFIPYTSISELFDVGINIEKIMEYKNKLSYNLFVDTIYLFSHFLLCLCYVKILSDNNSKNYVTIFIVFLSFLVISTDFLENEIRFSITNNIIENIKPSDNFLILWEITYNISYALLFLNIIAISFSLLMLPKLSKNTKICLVLVCCLAVISFSINYIGYNVYSYYFLIFWHLYSAYFFKKNLL